MFGRKKSTIEAAAIRAGDELNRLRRAHEALLRTQALAVCAPDGSFRAVGEAFAALLDHAPADLAATPIVALMSAASAPAWREAWAALERAVPLHGEFQCSGRHGPHWLRIAVTPIVDDEGRLVEALCFATDLSALRTALEDTRVELKVRQDIMNVTSIVSEADKKGDILSCNDKYTEISKYARDELIGHGHNITRHPDMPKAVFKEMWNTIGHGKIFRGVVKNRAKDGTPYYVDAVIAPILGDSGKPKKYLGVRYDITAQETERLNARGVLGAIDESFGYVEFDLSGKVSAANANFLTLTGYRLEDVVGRHHRMFVDDAQAGSEAYRALWADLVAGTPHTGLGELVSQAGQKIYLQATYAPVKDEMGRVTKLVMIATDVTAQKRYEMRVTEVLHETAEVMHEVRQGRLDVELSGRHDGEFAALQGAVNGTIEQLREVVAKIRDGARTINSAAVEVSRGNNDLSARTEAQASSLEETAASMEQMTSSVQQNAEHSRKANELAASAREQASEGGSVVSRAVQAMAAINESSRKIADIIGVIDEIAFQTNLLALNAAVEAARAGEQGRGFAVVASEVRNLAQRSATAAKEIKALINDSARKVAEGSHLVDESGRTLSEIVGSVKRVSDLIADIALASDEQASGISQVNMAVTQMDQMTQQNAALVEEAAAASESMDQESRALLEAVGFFKHEEAAASARPTLERRGADRPWSSARPATRRAANFTPQPAAAVGAEDEAWAEF
ncbi:MAG: methyl-accepting chemotaxis protein [Gammaproteobacteria bacterium]